VFSITPCWRALVTTTAVIVLGVLVWVLMAIPLALVVARVMWLNRPRVPAVEVSLASPVGTPVLGCPVEASPVFDPVGEVMARFPAEPARFVGRAEVMATASAALAPACGRSAVVFHGIAGAGKTTCAVELAYRRHYGFEAVAFWSAPTDPDQFGDALRLLVVAWEAQLADYGFAMLDEIATVERLRNFLPTLTAVLADANLLLILDNLDTLLTPDGQWRDPRWAPLIGALTSHQEFSRVILTSRIVPAGLHPDTVLILPVHALSRTESLRLIRRLPHLRAVMHTGLGRGVLTLTQGHPLLLELADAAAAEPPRLAYQLAEIDTAVGRAAPLTAFLTEGTTGLDAKQLLQTFTAWIITIATTLPAPARLLLQALCRMEETDRNAAVIDVTWPALWRRLGQPGEPPSLPAMVTALMTAALIATEPIGNSADPNEPVRYRIHPGIVGAIHTVTPKPVTAAVDAQLAAWWTIVTGGEREHQHTSNDINQFPARAGLIAARYLLRQHHGNGAQFLVRASLAAASYLVRQHDYHAASCLLECTLTRQGYSPVTSLAVIPLLRRIAEATGGLKDLVVLAAALRKVDSSESEVLLRRAYHQARTDGDDALASTTAGELITLLRDQGRFGEALTLTDQKIEHSRQAAFGTWTQLSDHGRRLQILHLLGHHEQVLRHVPALRTQIAELPDQRADNDRVNPWNTRENILDIARLSAMALHRWNTALELNHEITSTQQRRGASPHEIARTRFHDYLPLRHLDRLNQADHLLRHCQDVFDTSGDMTQLAVVYAARADLEDTRDHPLNAVDLQRTALRLCYLHPDPHTISTAHHNLANYLSHAAGDPAEQRAHRLSATLLHHLTGNTHELTTTLSVLAHELRTHHSNPDTPALPATLPEITRLLDTDNEIRLGDLVAALCPDTTTAEHTLINLLTAANPTNQTR
jgi:hypothetical protein